MDTQSSSKSSVFELLVDWILLLIEPSTPAYFPRFSNQTIAENRS